MQDSSCLRFCTAHGFLALKNDNIREDIFIDNEVSLGASQ